jgi:hypothetical protein
MKKKRAIKFLLIVIGAAVVIGGSGIIGFGIFLKARTGADFEGRPPDLLPPNTVFYFSFEQPAEFLEQIEASPLWREWEATGALRAFLDRKERLTKLQRNVEKVERFTPYKVKDRIIKRWLADRFSIALVPPPHDGLPPGIILLAQTQLGFEEDLAQFVAENFPEIDVVEYDTKSDGTENAPIEERITVYRGEKEKRSLAFVRFGRTVALSLRSAQTDYLEEIIHRRHDSSIQSLAGVEAFSNWQASKEGKAPLTIYAHPAETARMFLDHPNLRPEKDSQVESLEWFYGKTQKGALVTGALDCNGEELMLAVDLQLPQPVINQERLRAAAPRFQSLDFVTSQTLGLIAVKGADVDRLGDWLQRLVYLSKKGKKNWERSSETLSEAMGGDLAKALNQQIEREFGVVLQDVSSSMLFPQLDILGYVGIHDAKAMNEILKARSQNASGAFGKMINAQTGEPYFDIGQISLPVFMFKRAGAIASESDSAMILSIASDPGSQIAPRYGIDENGRRVLLDDEERSLALLYLNTTRLADVLDGIYASIPLFAKDLREDVERFLVYSALMAPFGSMSLNLAATDDGLRMSLSSTRAGE